MERNGRDDGAVRRPAVLVVCTGNLCRSPMFEAVLRAGLGERRAPVGVLSAGVSAVDRPIDPRTLQVIERWGLRTETGLDFGAHRARKVRPAWLRRADLIVAMERQHVRELVLLDPAALPRTFTAREIERFSSHSGIAAHDVTAADLRSWAAGMHSRRSMRDLMSTSGRYDIVDPLRASDDAFAACADEIWRIAMLTAELVWPSAASESLGPADPTRRR
jgi:protein-tyrosine phosphatase